MSELGFRIVREWGIANKRDRYNLVEAVGGQNMSDLAGQRLHIKAYILVESPNPDTGEVVKSLKVLTEENEVVGTRSQSFINGFERFLVLMESDECTEFEIVKQKSNAGRNYITFKA